MCETNSPEKSDEKPPRGDVVHGFLKGIAVIHFRNLGSNLRYSEPWMDYTRPTLLLD